MSKVKNTKIKIPFIVRDSRYTTVPEKVERIEELAFVETPDSPYVVDDSCFIPISEAIKQLQGNSVSAGEIEQTYDFPNGRDNGSSIPYTRRADVHDIAEISSQIMADADALSDKIAADRKQAQKQKEFNALVKPKETGNNSVSE